MKKFVVLVCVSLIMSGCASLKSASDINQQASVVQNIKPVSAITPDSKTLVYEHLTPVGAKLLQNAPIMKEAMSSADKKDAIIGVFNSESANTLMANAPGISFGLAAAVAAFKNSYWGILPGLVYTPVTAIKDVYIANYKMQEAVIQSNNALIAVAAASANAVEVERVYLPVHASTVTVTGENGIKFEVKGKETNQLDLTEKGNK